MSQQYLPPDRLCSWGISLNGARIGYFSPRMDLHPIQINQGNDLLKTTTWEGLIYVENSILFSRPVYIHDFEAARLLLPEYTFTRETQEPWALRGRTEAWKKITPRPAFVPMPELDLSHNHFYTGKPCGCYHLRYPCPTLHRAADKALASFQ